MKRRQLFNKGIMLAEIEGMFNKLLDTISKQDKEIEELEKQLKVSNINRIELARGFSEEIGVIITKKKLLKKQKEFLSKLEDDEVGK